MTLEGEKGLDPVTSGPVADELCAIQTFVMPFYTEQRMDMMSILSVLIVGSQLIAVSGLPIASHHPASLPVAGAPLQLVDDADFSTRKDAYLQKSRSEMDEWQNKVHGVGESAEAKGHEVSASAKAHFDHAWTATQRSWQKLQTAGADGWDKTKNAYERSTAELRRQWHKIHPED